MSDTDDRPPPGPLSRPDAVHSDASAPWELTRSAACRACGYDLRGLRSDGRCPECGTPVAASLQEGVAFAPPAYVGRLAEGAMLNATGVMFPAVMMASFWQFADRMPLGPLLMALFWCPGLWLLTTPDPAGAPVEGRRTARGWLRATCLPLFGLLLVWWLVGSHVMRAAPLAAAGANTALLAAVLVEVAVELGYLRTLAMRLGNVQLASRTRIEMWGVTISVGLFVLTDLLSALRKTAIPLVMLDFSFVIGMGMLVFALCWVLLLTRYEHCLSRARRDAELNWARHLARLENAADPPASPTPPNTA